MPDHIKKKETPCKDHFHLMSDKATRFYNVCPKCGWRILGAGDWMRPVKFENRWFDH
jgi:DNA-directed RNA polymerase subunit RPC12/RpoP